MTARARRWDIDRARRRLRRWADQIGPVGLIGVAIIATCIGYYAGSIDPQRQHLDALRAGTAAGPETERRATPADDASSRLLQFAEGFPDEKQLSSLLGRLYEIGEREGVRLSQGEYRLIEPDALGIIQYKMVLPVVASYPNMRRFVASALTELPTLAITQINMQRERVGQGQIEARLELTLYLRLGSAVVAGQPQTPSDVTRGPEVNR